MHQYLFAVGAFPVRMYGLITILAIALATGVAYFLAKQDGRWHQHVIDIGIYGGCAGLIGGRLWHCCFFDWAYYSQHLAEIPAVWHGGMAIQGGIIAGVIAGIIYCIKHKIDWIEFGDIVCPSLIFGQAVGRIANLLNGDAFGAPTNSNFGLLYPPGTLAHATYGDLPLWPAEVWEGQIDLIIFGLLLIYKATEPKKGRTLCLYPVLYSLARFGLEFLRGDYAQAVWLGLSSAQLTSLIISIIFALLWLRCDHNTQAVKN